MDYATGSSPYGRFPSTATASERRLAWAGILAVFSYVLLANAWLGDDGYITYRVVDNFVHGYGLTFNPPERVQVYTHPLWMMVLVPLYAVTREFAVSVTMLSWALGCVTMLVLLRWTDSAARGVVLALLLVGSKAFADYLSSGLEYPISYLLIALFFSRVYRAPRPLRTRDLSALTFIAALGFLNRMDTILLFLPTLVWLLVADFRLRPAALVTIVLASLPAPLWLLFSTIYYGFPFPNTYYAKVATGIPSWLMYEQGFSYLANSFSHDPITLSSIGVAAALALASRSGVLIAAMAGSLWYVLYTIAVGGDFMSGRFFAMPFLVAAMVIVARLSSTRTIAGAAAALCVYNIVTPLAPIKTRWDYNQAWTWRLQNGIKDERGSYHQVTNILYFDPFRTLPDQVWYRQGISLRNSPEKVSVQGSIGYLGYTAGPDRYLIDRNALSDPLLARLPVSDRLYYEFYVGHYFRDIPAGYVESVRDDRNEVADPLLHEVYERLRRITRGPIFTAQRFRDIWAFNAGRYRTLHDTINAQRRTDLSIRANNERFQTDVGQRDPVAGTLRVTGEPGYLQYGPRTPLRAGQYRIRWVGVYEGPSTGTVGALEVWADDKRIARREITAGEYMAERRAFGELAFAIREDVKRIEYRFFVNAGQPVLLERVEISGAPNVPIGY